MTANSTVESRAGAAARGPYVAALVAVSTLGVLLSAFDSVARNVALPLVIKDLGINVGEAGLVFSGGFVASFAANIALGSLIDRVGRKRAFIITLVATGITSGATAFVSSLWEYALVGFFAGVCLSVQTSAQILTAEEVPARWRGMSMGIVTAGFSGGVIIIGVVGSIVLPAGHWRLLFLLSFLPIGLAILAAFLIKEPMRAREALAVKAGDKAAQRTYAIDESAATRAEWRQIFAPDLRRQTIVASVFGILVNFSTGFVLALGSEYVVTYDHVSVGAASLAIVIDGAASVVGALVVGALSDRWASRDLLVVWSALGGLSLILLAFRGGITWVFLVLALFGFFGQGALGCWWRYLADSFPTRTRGTGSGVVVGIFFLGNAFAPAAFGGIMNTGNEAPAAVAAGAIAIVGAFVLLLLGARISARRQLEDIRT
jgi:MFS family permease